MVDISDVDSGVGSEGSALLLVAIQDGLATESTVVAFTTTESGIAQDLATLVAAITGTDTAAGAETVNALLGHETGHGAELGALIHVAMDSGHGVDLFEFATIAGSLTISIAPLGSLTMDIELQSTETITLTPLGTVTIRLSVAPEVS